MRALLIGAIALTAAATSLVTAPATASPPPAVPGPGGLLCTYTSTSDPVGDANDMTGEVDAGPAITNVPGTLRCAIRVGYNTHSGPAAAIREFPASSGGLIAGAQTVSYSTVEGQREYLCTSFRKADGTTIYYYNGSHGFWHTDPSYRCGSAHTPIDDYHLVDDPFGWGLWDPIATCARLQDHHGSPAVGTYVDDEGDVFVDLNASGGTTEAEAMDELWYDCPIYTFTINDNSNPDLIDGGVIDES